MSCVRPVLRYRVALDAEGPNREVREGSLRPARLRLLPPRLRDEADEIRLHLARRVGAWDLVGGHAGPPHARSAACSAVAARSTRARMGASTSKRRDKTSRRSRHGSPRSTSFRFIPFPCMRRSEEHTSELQSRSDL